MNAWRLLVAGGAVLFVLGAVELVRPGTAPLPASEVLLSVLGGLALLYAAGLLYARRREETNPFETPDVEVTTVEVPGTDLGRTLGGFPDAGDIYGSTSPSVRGDLRRVAESALTRFEGVDPETAQQQIAEGDWTADPYAATYLGRERLSFRDRVRSLFSGQSVRDRTVDAIAAVAGVDPDGEGTEPTRYDQVDETSTDPVPSGPQQTGHWTGVSVVVLACLGLGLVLREPGVLLAGAVAVGYVAYARATPQDLPELSVSRSLSDTDPEPGAAVEVTLTVTNEGGFCPDLRIVDGVPASLVVSDGSPRRGVALRAGESATLSYTVTAKQGSHTFGPALVVARNLSNAVERTVTVEADTTLTVVPTPMPVQASVPLRQHPTQYAGRAPTDTGGEGLEFHTVREYQPGDSMSRVDWNRRARTGELTTLEFRRERATRVQVLVDARPEADVGHDPAGPSAIERSLAAAQRVVPALLDEGHQVGIGAFGPQNCFLAPDSGVSHRRRCRDLLATDPAFHGQTESERRGRYWLSQFRQQLPDNTQLLVFTPLLDGRAVRALREFEAYGYPVTVVSPDPTMVATPSGRLMRARRRVLVTELRQAGVPVLDWSPDDSLETVLEREGARR